MSVTKDSKRGTWTMYTRYTDWQGVVREKRKRGFATKREALEYEREFLLKKAKDINMSFEKFVEIYMDDLRPRLKPSTYENKQYIIRDKILPYFRCKSLAEITPTDVIQWQNELLSFRDSEGKPYSPTYLRSVQNQLSAIMNHACKYYDLPKNPCKQLSKMGKAKAKEMLFWTKDEYLAFAEVMKEKPVSFYAFEILYWCGIREGELLALTRGDIDLAGRRLSVNKAFQVIRGCEVISTPKTDKSNRVIDMPEFLCDELEDYFGMLYKCDADTRLFEISKSYLHHEMDRGCKGAGVKRIRIHDLRHSHVAYLIELGFSTVEIAERLGHENISVTSTYSHLYPSKQKSMAEKINAERIKDMKSEDE
ncbi:MAG: site-specific integrase [Pseudobutyrivibrio sp.]|nr:site-specific integrase [Pseudobutyrivibrio sp.]